MVPMALMELNDGFAAQKRKKGGGSGGGAGGSGGTQPPVDPALRKESERRFQASWKGVASAGWSQQPRLCLRTSCTRPHFLNSLAGRCLR